MVAQKLKLAGKEFVIVSRVDFDRLTRRAAVIDDVTVPALPPALRDGTYPALKAGRALLAQKLIRRRWALVSGLAGASTQGLAPAPVDCAIDDDPVQPGREGALGVVALAVAVDRLEARRSVLLRLVAAMNPVLTRKIPTYLSPGFIPCVIDPGETIVLDCLAQ